MKKFLPTVLGLGCAVATVLVPATADAAARPVPTDVHMKQGYTYDQATDTVTMRGTLSSSRRACAEGRKVVLRQTDDNLRAGDDLTNENGRWRISFRGQDVSAGAGNFAAVAPEVKVGAVRCAAGRDAQNIFEAPRVAWH